jgi:hypothetical protein
MRVFWGAIAVAVIIVVFYIVPTALEIKLTPILGTPAILFLGDLPGCAGIAVLYRKTGIGLYLALAAAKFGLLKRGLLPIAELSWTADLLPTLALVILAILLARSESDGLYGPRFERLR